MTTALSYRLTPDRPKQIGLVILQSDETIELDFRKLVPDSVELLVSRVPSGNDVTPETLAEMEQHLATAAALFPRTVRFDAVAYGCTSGTAQIGPGEVAAQIRNGTVTAAVTEPVSALIAACGALGIGRLALISPYVAPVSDRIRAVLDRAGVATPVFGSFLVPDEARVARIDAVSIVAAAESVAKGAEVDGIFLSCTNLRTLEIIPEIEARLDRPVLSSNQVLAWHLLHLAGVSERALMPGRLFATHSPVASRDSSNSAASA
ncbi:Asp/Glu racemase [Pseudoruegeria sp. HB172150]|uniref:maleate cis-trans isomerase family protein n=1 Tax=Pseudoruegeria sp. HB172150 TaxID=2721164 RepID=UPI001556AB99|nr:Asp/Glu racemase [Pseudoruegeria sp. HB172150]